MLKVAVRKRLGALDLDCAFEAGPGVTILFGRSGSGKTSLLNMIAGLLRPDAGAISIDDEVLEDSKKRFTPPHRRRFGYVFQDALLFPHVNVRANLDFGRRFSRAPADPVAFARVTEMLGIGALLERMPERLSGGEKQRVAIGRALLSNPRLLLLDEPLASLDQQRKDEIMPYLERLRAQTQAPIVYVTHSMAEVTRLADKFVLLRDGRVVAAGAPQDVLHRDVLHRDVLHRADALDSSEAAGAAAMFDAIVDHIEPDGLAALDCALGRVWAPADELTAGARVRLAIFASDVLIASQKPVALSALNVFEAKVATIAAQSPAIAQVELACANGRLWSHVTHRSATALKLAPGLSVYVIVKSVALDT
jgi:molybdate transport system ATP-binding protein